MLSGDNGILNRARQARDDSIVGQEKEQVELAYISAAVNKLDGDVEEEDLRIELNSSVGTGKTTVSTNSDSSLKVKFEDTKNEYIVSQNGKVEKFIPKVLVATNVYAKLYDDGTLVLSSSDYTDSSKTVTKDFGLVENKSASNYWSASDYNTLVTKVSFYDEIVPNTTAYYFNNLTNLTTFEKMNNLETGLVTDMSYMFAGCGGLSSIDVSHFDTSKVTNMRFMFAGSVKQTNTPTTQYNYYEGNIKTLNLSNFDTGKVTDMAGMFAYQVSLETVNLSSFDTSNVTSMSYMFNSCTSLTTLDLSHFNTSNVTDMDQMFRCMISSGGFQPTYYYYNNSTTTRSSLKTIYVSDLWDISKVRMQRNLADRMFNGCVSLVGAISYDSSKNDQTYANYTTGYLTYKSNS